MEDNQQEDNKNNDNNNIAQSLDVDVEKLQNDLSDAMNGWKRAVADFDNFRRRKEAENKELVEFAREVTVAKLLPTLDSLEQALKHIPEYPLPNPPHKGEGMGPVPLPSGEGLGEGEFAKQYQNWQVGINGIVMQLNGALGELGIKKIQSVGKKFDPHFHEAVKEVESEAEDGMIVDEMQTGFELNGKVIRASQVVISKKK